MRRSGELRPRRSATAAVSEGTRSPDASAGSAARGGGSSAALGAAAAPAGKAAERLASRGRYQPQAVPVLGYASMDPQPGGPRSDFRGQAEKIASECERRGLSLLDVVRERVPQRERALTRPGLAYALQQLSSGQAKGLVVADLSRLTRSVPQLGPVLAWFSRSGARLIAVAEGMDTAEPAGRLVVRTLMEVSRWESQRLAERTRKGMRVARRKGPPCVADDPELKERIARMRADGMTLQQIADRLNREGVPTVRNGAKWRPSSVQTAAGYRRPRAGQRLDPLPRDDVGGLAS
jgi:DNA invertase Pin-like site-specific DNA recombinase